MVTPHYLGTVPMQELQEFVGEWLSHEGREMVTVMVNPVQRVLHYLGFDPEQHQFCWWSVPIVGETLVSLVDRAGSLGWAEREVAEVAGLSFTTGRPEPLIDNDQRRKGGLGLSEAPTNLQSLMYGPIRGDVLESARFEFAYAGEAILEYRPYLFYKRRDMERRFEGLTLQGAAVLAERVSGDDSVAHVLALSQAVEAALGIEVPRRAQLVRAILAELERLTNHLRVWGDLAKTTTLRVGDAEGHFLQERVRQLNGLVTGHRFLRSVISPGGVRRDLDLAALEEGLGAIIPDIAVYRSMLERTKGFYDRLSSTGVLSGERALVDGATGPVARASGVRADVRVDAPYGAYQQMTVATVTASEGDAWARFAVRAGEITNSLALIRDLIDAHRGSAEPLMAEAPVQKSGASLGVVEATRGRLSYLVEVEDTRISYVGIGEPSFANWQVFSATVRDTNMMDYAINEASFGLSIAGADR